MHVPHNQWQTIDTASKEPDEMGLMPEILLGFAPDEEGYTLPSREGRWSIHDQVWIVSIDPTFTGYGPPTHWMPLPPPPEPTRIPLEDAKHKIDTETLKEIDSVVQQSLDVSTTLVEYYRLFWHHIVEAMSTRKKSIKELEDAHEA